MGKYKLIANPESGKGAAREKIPIVTQLLSEYKITYNLSLTEYVGHAQEIAQNEGGNGYEAIIALGGDGTVNEVLNGLMALKAEKGNVPHFGVIPLGRGNDFICGVNIPPSLEDSCRVIAEGHTSSLDIGKISGGYFPGGRYFGNGIGIGFDTIVGLTAARMKRIHGALAYIWGALHTIFSFPEPPEMEILFNDKVIRQRATQISIMNGKRMGGTFFMAPDSCSHDGKFDLLLTENLSRGEMMKVISMLTKGTAGQHPKIKTERSAKFTINSTQGRMVCHADGETICTDGEKLVIECLPDQIRIISSPQVN